MDCRAGWDTSNCPVHAKDPRCDSRSLRSHLTLSLALPSCAAIISLSGKVTDSRTHGALSGVQVSLAKNTFSATTAQNGTWSIIHQDTTTGLSGRPPAISSATHLSVRNGRIVLRYGGHDLLGHVRPEAPVAASPVALARSAAIGEIVDTLLFRWKDTIRARLPIASYEQSGISVALDTSSLFDSTYGIPWNISITYGSLTDSRDGQVYRTVTIGSQTWMAQNLNYRNTTGRSDTVGACYGNSADSCAKYGRLYTWPEVMNGSSSRGATGICPTGWHVPIYEGWLTLVKSLGSSTAGRQLKSTSGWNDSGNGTDAHGFRVLPAGHRCYDGTFLVVGSIAYFWTSSVSGTSGVDYWSCANSLASMLSSSYDKTYGLSLRCLRD